MTNRPRSSRPELLALTQNTQFPLSENLAWLGFAFRTAYYGVVRSVWLAQFSSFPHGTITGVVLSNPQIPYLPQPPHLRGSTDPISDFLSDSSDYAAQPSNSYREDSENEDYGGQYP